MNTAALFLDAEGLVTLTGRRRRRAQIAWLKSHGRGIKWWVNGAGNPVVPVSNFAAPPAAANAAVPEATPPPQTWAPRVLTSRP